MTGATVFPATNYYCSMPVYRYLVHLGDKQRIPVVMCLFGEDGFRKQCALNHSFSADLVGAIPCCNSSSTRLPARTTRPVLVTTTVLGAWAFVADCGRTFEGPLLFTTSSYITAMIAS